MFLGEKAHTLICIGCLLRDICCSGSAMRSCLFVVSVCNVMVRLVEEPLYKVIFMPAYGVRSGQQNVVLCSSSNL